VSQDNAESAAAHGALQMRDSIQPARLARSRRAHLLAVALPLLNGSWRQDAREAQPARLRPGRRVLCRLVRFPAACAPPVSCYTPRVFRVAYGIQPLLDGGIDGRGETVTVLAPASASAALWGGLMALADQDAHHGLGFVNPANLPHRPQLQLPQGIPRHHYRQQQTGHAVCQPGIPATTGKS
jgi:hypothetical protein